MKKDTKPKMGRPKVANPADKQLPRIRVTESQLEAYKAASEVDSVTLSAWVRDKLDTAAKVT